MLCYDGTIASRSHGKSLNNYSFKYGVNKLNNVKSYKYLVMTLNPYGNFTEYQ